MIETLAGLRGLAVLFVVAGGLAAVEVLPPEFGSGLDQIGLMIVIVVSGFLVALHHADEVWDLQTVGTFLRTRAGRLLPLYYFMVALSAAITGWWSAWPFRIDTLPTAARAIFLVDAPGALDVVPTLAQLYLLFVILWWMRDRGWHVVALLAVVLVGCFVSHAAPVFFVGVLIGTVWASRLEPLLHERMRIVSAMGAGAFVLVCINLPAVRLAHGWTLGHGAQSATWADPVSALVVVTLLVAAAASPPSLTLLGSTALRVLGRCFYPVYLLTPVVVAVAR
jgi:peptidoglycan/LPS O-acetylase OafA/YrhL